MSETVQYILIALAAVVLLAVTLKLFRIGFKTIFKLLINAAIGIGAIFLLNLIPGVEIPIEWWTALLTGILGIPGALIALIVSFLL